MCFSEHRATVSQLTEPLLTAIHPVSELQLWNESRISRSNNLDLYQAKKSESNYLTSSTTLASCKLILLRLASSKDCCVTRAELRRIPDEDIITV